MNFGEAINAMKEGHRVQREGWNGKNLFVEIAKDISYVNPNGEVIKVKHDAMGSQAFCFNFPNGYQMGWIPSQSDSLGNDWKII